MRERRNYLILMALITAAVVGATLLAIPGSPIYRAPTLGLDLQGGLEVVLKAVPDPGQTIDAAKMQTAQSIMEKRANETGAAAPNVAIQGQDEIVIQLAGVKDPATAAKIVGSTGKLQFFDFEKDLAPPTISSNGTPTPFSSLYSLLTNATVKSDAKKGTPSQYYLFSTTTTKGKKGAADKHVLMAGPYPTQKQLLAQYRGHQPKDSEILTVPANREVVSDPNGAAWYLFYYFPEKPNGPPELTGDDLNEGDITADTGQDGQPEVRLGFTSRGQRQFTKITKAEYDRGQLVAGLNGSAGTFNPQFAQHNAIVLDGILQATPYIDYTDTGLSLGIQNGAVIGQMGTTKAAEDLALVLQSGSLPYTFKQLAQNTVTATLGKSSLHQAILAAIAGLLIVALFLLVLYRFLGLVAVLGLAVYGILYYASVLLFNVTLTLPGFAGLILTIGVAADANVVVFERIKEEVRAGKSVRSAISAGYGKGFHTILDANVVTVIAAMVIYLIAVADVKGFALMLLIGTLISLLTAVAATRALLGLLSGFRWFDNPRFMGAHGQQTATWLQVDFMKRRNIWFGISGAIVVAGVVALSVSGLNLGIDFKGGTVKTFSTPQPHAQSEVASLMSELGYPEARVTGRGNQVKGENKQWEIRYKTLDRKAQTQLDQTLTTQLGAFGGGTKAVSGTFGHQIAVDAIYGIIVSLLLITIYITVRFDLKYAIPVILAMLHDIVITVGVYAISGKEVSVDTVAAVLTVLGYSIYDTIIIFDRIRENVPLMRKSPFATIANVSLWETIRRSLATTFITLLPIICLEILGGATLKDFAFALIVGVTSGAYSSIFIAAPILTMWKEREPEFARRKASAKAESGTQALLASEEALAAEPTPELADALVATPSTPEEQDRREKRRQRRRSRPHGRTR